MNTGLLHCVRNDDEERIRVWDSDAIDAKRNNRYSVGQSPPYVAPQNDKV